VDALHVLHEHRKGLAPLGADEKKSFMFFVDMPDLTRIMKVDVAPYVGHAQLARRGYFRKIKERR